MKKVLTAVFATLLAFSSSMACAATQETPAIEEYELGGIEYYNLKMPNAAAAKKRVFIKLINDKKCSDGRTPVFVNGLEDSYDPNVCYNIGVALLKGDFDDIDPYNPSSTPSSNKFTSSLYYSGSIEKPRAEYACRYFHFAAKKGFAPAQYAYGLMLYNGFDNISGEGRGKDMEEIGKKYILLASDAGFEQAVALAAEITADAEAEAKAETERKLRQAEAERLQAERERQAEEAQLAEQRLLEEQRRQAAEEAENARVARAQRQAAEEALHVKFLIDNQDKIVSILKDSHLDSYPAAQSYPAIAKALNGFFKNPNWEFHVFEKRDWIVAFTGIGTLDGQNAKFQLVFVGLAPTEEQLQNKELKFRLQMLFINDVQRDELLNNLLAAIYLD